jgi:hypothetical protein
LQNVAWRKIVSSADGSGECATAMTEFYAGLGSSEFVLAIPAKTGLDANQLWTARSHGVEFCPSSVFFSASHLVDQNFDRVGGPLGIGA